MTELHPHKAVQSHQTEDDIERASATELCRDAANPEGKREEEEISWAFERWGDECYLPYHASNNLAQRTTKGYEQTITASHPEKPQYDRPNHYSKSRF